MAGKNNIVRDKSFAFAVTIIKLSRFLCDTKKEYVLAKQLLRSGISIGANIREASNAQSKRDFLGKMNIALKEADETLYWIELLLAAEIIDGKQKESIWAACNELVSILSSIDLFNNHLNQPVIVYDTTNQSHSQRMPVVAMSPVRI